MREINILILSAGRRVELIQCFKNAAKKLKINSKIVAADISDTAPAIYFADERYQIPRIGEEGYIESVIEICQKEKISLIVPTIDTELKVLSQHKSFIEERCDARVLISDQRVIDICRNKHNTQKFFEENGFGVPRQIQVDEEPASYPVFIKPLDGSSSINAFAVNNKEELAFFRKYIPNPIIQEFMRGTEYTIDTFLDFDSHIISIVPRIRLATRGGEVLKGKIIKDREIMQDVQRLLSVLKPIGQVTIQCMKTEKGIQYIEINPRFGGGAPMSIKAGADSCEYLYRLLNGEKVEYTEDYQDEVTFLRFDDSIMLPPNVKK